MRVMEFFTFTVKFMGRDGFLKLIYTGETIEEARAKLHKEHPNCQERGWVMGLQYITDATGESIKTYNAKVMEGTNE